MGVEASARGGHWAGEPEEIETLKRWGSTTDQALWAKLDSMESTLEVIEVGGLDEWEQLILGQCRERLSRAKACIQKRGRRRRWFTKNYEMFWRLIHACAEDMILIMPLEMLAARYHEVLEDFQRNVQDPITRKAWLGADGQSGFFKEIGQDVDASLAEGARTATAGDWARLRYSRQMLRGALQALNDRTDKRFSQLNFTMLVRNLSSLLVCALFGLSWCFSRFGRLWRFPEVVNVWGWLWPPPLTLISFLMLGAAGAIISNMVSGGRVTTTTSPTYRQYLYYLFVKPTLGAFAALVIFLLGKSGILFSLEVGEHLVTGAAQAPVRIVLSAPPALFFTYAVISVAAGFSADRILGLAMDRVTERLFAQAEKTVSAPPEAVARGVGDAWAPQKP